MTSTALPTPVAKAEQKAEKALADARKHAEAASGFQHFTEVAQEAAEAARTWAEADEAADQAAADAKGAAEAVKDCKRALQRAQRARTECRKAGEAVEDDALCASEVDSAFERVKDAVETAREALGTAEEAAEAAQEVAEAARETADDECMKCGEWLCACREVMCAMLARYGSGAARTVDAEAVRIGELIMSDDEELYAAGQLMLAEEREAAEEALATAEETQEAAEERRARVASAEITERTLVERHEGRTAREWVDVADWHAERSTAAYETAREIVRDLDRGGRPLVTDEEYAQMRAAFRRVDRRSITAHDYDCRARHDVVDDYAPVTDPQRAAQWARRAEIFADACEADARLVAELLAWPEAEERAAEAAVNGSPYLAYPELTDRGSVRGWKVGYCIVHPYTGVRIVDSAPDEYEAEASADAKNEEHRERQRAAAEALVEDAPAAEESTEAPVEEERAADEEAAEGCVSTVVEVGPAAVRRGDAPVSSPLSRRAHGGRYEGVRAGHTARQLATRQPARQVSGGSGSRAPPSSVRRPAGCRHLPGFDRGASKGGAPFPGPRGGES